MHEISIPDNCSSNCFDSVFYSLLKYLGLDYKAYNMKYFYTDYYDSTSDNLTYYISRGNSNVNILKDLYNIDLTFIAKSKSTHLFEIVRDSIKYNPILIIIDPYYCYWSPFYKKSHYSHIILIVGIDYINKKYICFDVHFNSFGYTEIDFEIVNSHFERYYIVDFKKTDEIELDLMIDKLHITLNNFDNNLDIKKSKMVNYFTLSDKKALFPEELETSVPLINLMWIAEDKKHFQIAMKYIENRMGRISFSPLYELLSNSEQSFLLLKSILTKYAITGVLKEDKLVNIIKHFFDTDALIVDKMHNVLKEIKYKDEDRKKLHLPSISPRKDNT